MALRLLVALLLLGSVLAGPTADLVAFGLHEHGAGAASDILGMHVQHSHGAASHEHHCDFWMNPGDLSAPTAVEPPNEETPLLVRHRSSRLIARPFRPFAPPRT